MSLHAKLTPDYEPDCKPILISDTSYPALTPDGEGVSLADRWAQGMEAFASTPVSGFPNLFLINGPNTVRRGSSCRG